MSTERQTKPKTPLKTGSGLTKIIKRSANGLHKDNLHSGRYDFAALTYALPALKEFVLTNPNGEPSIDFANPEAVKCLNKALLKAYYGVEHWDIPKGYLCPPIPGRADYVHRLNEWLQLDLMQGRSEKARLKVSALDIGTGANCIYPIIGASRHHWRWVGSDIDPVSVKNANAIINANDTLKRKIEIRAQNTPEHIFQGIIKAGELFVVTSCNPPFHRSLEEAQAGTERKNANLSKNQQERGNKNQTSRLKAKAPLNFGGQNAELWCQGGEQAFVLKMAKESKAFANQVIWFSTLLSKKDNIRPLRKQLERLGASDILIQEMAQGQKKSRFVAWSFMNHENRLAITDGLV